MGYICLFKFHFSSNSLVFVLYFIKVLTCTGLEFFLKKFLSKKKKKNSFPQIALEALAWRSEQWSHSLVQTIPKPGMSSLLFSSLSQQILYCLSLFELNFLPFTIESILPDTGNWLPTQSKVEEWTKMEVRYSTGKGTKNSNHYIKLYMKLKKKISKQRYIFR